MTTENDSINDDDQNKTVDDNHNDKGGEPDIDKGGEPDIDKFVQERVQESLKDIKAKLDNAYRARDAALAKAAALEQKAKEEEIKRLESEGKHKEALELQLAEERAKLAAVEKRNMELSRDVAVRTALNSLNFRNERAANTAFRDIVSELVRNESGQWVHKSGASIESYIESFAKDEENSFLFKAKANSGGGTGGGGGSPDTTAKSLFEMSQAEVIKMAREGKLPSQRK